MPGNDLSNLLAMRGLPTITGMGYQALLFCADDKAIRVVSQVLSELDFHVEVSAEPFAAVKRLAGEHFDALVVDCDDEQNSALLFKTARNSELNNASLAVALVQGQGGIAKAFKIGANLILTKPINAEQSKGTLRVARGMLRKAEAGKAAGATITSTTIAAAPAALAASPTEPSTSTSALEAAAAEALAAVDAASAKAAKNSEEVVAKAESAISAKAGSASEATSATESAGSAKKDSGESSKYDWQNQSKKAADSAPAVSAKSEKTAASASASSTTSAKAEAAQSEIASSAKSSGSGQQAGAATARAKQAPAASSTSEKSAAPSASSSSSSAATKKAETGKTAVIAKKEPVKAESVKQPANFSWSDAARDNEAGGGGDSKRNFAIAAVLVLALAAGGYFAWPQLEPYLMNVPVLQKFIGSESPAPQAPAPVVRTPATTPTASAAEATTAAATGASTTPAGAPGAPASTSATPVVLTQDAANQLLLKKTNAVYPAAARQKKLAGDVELQATVGKDGSVTDVKVVSGDDILAHSAGEAVRQWKYKPYLVNGQAVEFQTPVSISFKSTN